MKIILSIILAIAIIIGGYVFIQDQKIKKSLSGVEQAQFVDQGSASTTADVASEIIMSRSGGVWNVSSTGEYTIDPASLKFEFTGYKPGGQHVGTFNTINAKIMLDATGAPVQSVLTIDPISVKTDAAALDTHLQTAEFFDAATYPEIVVTIKQIKNEGGSMQAITDLTMKGVTKTLAIPVVVTPVEGGASFAVDTRIKISDYAVAYGPVQDEVRVIVGGVLKKK